MVENISNESFAFKSFTERHEAVNRWFRSSEIAICLARIHTENYDGAVQVRKLFKNDNRPRETTKQYRGRFSEEGRAPEASVDDFNLDMKEGWQSLLESVIVQEVGALEMFLREWMLAAIEEALTSSHRVSPTRVKELNTMATEIKLDPYRSMSLSRVASTFPTLRHALETTTHLRSTRPFLSTASGSLSCRAVADLWREVRNLILHHDRIVHHKFFSNHSQVWLEMQTEAQSRGGLISPKQCKVGAQLPIAVRHAVFCLTSCYQIAVLLHVAANGET